MINYFQHIAIGVSDLDKTYEFYRDILGFRIIFFDCPSITVPDGSLDPAGIKLQLIHNVRMMFVMHPDGGAAIEFVQFTATDPRPPPSEVKLGDIGFNEIAIRVHRLDDFVKEIKSRGFEMLTPVLEKKWIGNSVRKYAYLRDPDGSLIQLVEEPSKDSKKRPRATGLEHMSIGVRDIEATAGFYTDTLQFGKVLHKWDEVIDGDYGREGGSLKTRNVVIGTVDDKPGKAGMFNQSRLQLVQAIDHEGIDILKDRRWGDIGLLEIAMDVSMLGDTVSYLTTKSANIYTHMMDLKLGFGSYGYFTFIQDPEGNLVELVNLEKIYFLPSNVLGGAIYKFVKGMDTFSRANYDLDPFFDVKIVADNE